MATSSTQLLMDQLRMQQAFARSTRPQTSGFSQALSYSSAIGRSYEAAATNLVRGVTATGARDIGAVREAMEKLTGYAEKAPVTHRQGIVELQGVLKTKEAQLLKNNEAVESMNLLKKKLDTLHSQPGHNESQIKELLSAMANNYITESKETDQYVQNEIKAIYDSAADRETAYHKYMSVDADLEKEGFQPPAFGPDSDTEQAYYKDLTSGYEAADRTGKYTQFLSLFDTPNVDVMTAKTADVNIARAKRGEERSIRGEERSIRAEERSIRGEARQIENDRLAKKAAVAANFVKLEKAKGEQKSLLITDIVTQMDSFFKLGKRGMAKFTNEVQGNSDRQLYHTMPVLSDNYTTTSGGRIATIDIKGAIRNLDMGLIRLMDETAKKPEDKIKAEWMKNAKNMLMDPSDPIRKQHMEDFIARNSNEFGPIPEGFSKRSNSARTKRYSAMALLDARKIAYELLESGLLFGEDYNDETNNSETNKDGGFSLSKGIKKKQ